jgi:hypothetical protein
MGAVVKVRCQKCRFTSRELFGIGGDYGMTGEVALTVLCTKGRKLVDVEVPSLNVARGDQVPSVTSAWPPTAPCPIKGCGATDHKPWDPETAVCPSCGEPSCEIENLGCWD